MVGLTGIVTIGLLVANSLIRSDRCGIPDPPLFALLLIIIYGVMANICYTLGAFAEIVARVTMGKESASKLERRSSLASRSR